MVNLLGVEMPLETALGFVSIFGGLGGILVGRLLDPNFFARQMRRWTRKNYIGVGIVAEDSKTISPRVINPELDLFIIEEFAWIIKKNTIYRVLATELSKFALKDEKFFESQRNYVNIVGKKVKWQEGVPWVFVNKETVKTLDFFEEKSGVKPAELSANNQAWIAVQRKKDQMANQNMMLLMIAILAIAAVAAYFAWQAHEQGVALAKTGVTCAATLPPGATLANGSINIPAGGK